MTKRMSFQLLEHKLPHCPMKSKETSYARGLMSGGRQTVASLLRHFPVVKMDSFLSKDLVGLMPFSGDEHDIILASTLYCFIDRFCTIRNNRDRPGAGKPGKDLLDDFKWIFLPGIVACHNHFIRKRLCSRCHFRTLAGVAVAAAPKDRNDLAFL